MLVRRAVLVREGPAAIDQTRLQEQVQQAVLDLESKTADLRHIEADLEAVRQAHYESGDQLNQAQGHLYEASAEVGSTANTCSASSAASATRWVTTPASVHRVATG